MRQSSNPRGIVVLLLLGSGFCALVYQTTWLREFRLFFGVSTAASAAVLGVFMAGMGAGGIVLGRRSENKARPLAFYAKLELLIALTAAATPLLIIAARNLYIAMGGTHVLGPLGGNAVRLVLAAMILGVPTFLMGGTLPAAARAVVAREDVERRSIGLLYGINTLGAVSGAAIATFFLFERLGNHATLWLACVLNVVVAAIAFAVARSMPEIQPEATTTAPQTVLPNSRASGATFVLIAAAVVGFAFFLMELVWYRMLAPLLGGSTFSFGLILSVALLGIGLGGAAYAFLNLKKAASLNFFALTCAGEALFIALPYALGDRIAMGTMLLRSLGTLGFYGHVIAWTALCVVVVFPAALIAGLQFPLLIALLGKGNERVGRQTGAAYAWNTAGALIGSLVGGFGFIPLFSAPGVWRLVTVLLCALAAFALCLDLPNQRQRIRLIPPLALTALALMMLWAVGPTAFWRHSQIGVGRLEQFKGSATEMHDLMQRTRRRILWEADGIESSVALSKASGLSFIVNGRSEGNAKVDAGTQIMLGLIGAALHPHPTKAMVIGLGTGATAGWLAAVPEIQQVDVSELEPAILNVARDCAPANHNALANPKVHVAIGDGREALLTSRQKYDLIVSEPSHPNRAGIAGLFTREFYQSVRERLETGGMFFQWVQAYEIDDRSVQTIYRTLGSVFPHIESWQTEESDLLLLATREPVSYNVAALRARLAREPFKSALANAWRGDSLEDFLAHYVGNEMLSAALQHLDAPPLNTDDRTVIEFALARSLNLGNRFQIGDLRAGAQEAQADRPQHVNGDVDWARVEEARLVMIPSQEQLAKMTPDQLGRLTAFASYNGGDLSKALRQWRSQTEEPKILSHLTLLAECLAAEGNGDASVYIDELAKTFPWDAQAIRARLLWTQRKPQEVTETLHKVFQNYRQDPWPSSDIIRRSFSLAEAMAKADSTKVVGRLFYDDLRQPFCIFNEESDRLLALLSIGGYLDGNELGAHTRSAIAAFEPYPIWNENFLRSRNACYQVAKSPLSDQAARDLKQFQKESGSTALDFSVLTKTIENQSRVP
jgi:spermidine synthase